MPSSNYISSDISPIKQQDRVKGLKNIYKKLGDDHKILK